MDSGSLFLACWYVCIMFLGWAYTCQFRSFVLLPSYPDLIDTDEQVGASSAVRTAIRMDSDVSRFEGPEG